MLATALALAGHSFAVFPCRPRSKIPATLRGFKDASRDADVIRQWWTANPSFNIAVATGEKSGCFVADLDGSGGIGEMGRLEAQFGELPKTLTACTSDGLHLYFKWPDKPVPCSAGKVAPSIDIRGDGGFVICPPSIHPGGKRYTWANDSGDTIATAPDWLLDRAIGHNGNGKCTPTEVWRDLVANGVDQGCRNHTAARLIGHLLHKYVDLAVARELIHCWNEARCRPPLLAAEIDQVIDSISGRDARRRGNGW